MLVCPKCDLRHFDTSSTRCVLCKAELVHGVDPRIGTVLSGRYRLEAVIGEGGMAIVYLARHTLMERPYAVKVLHGHFSGDDKLVERMRREARTAAALTHPNIIEIYDFGTTDDGCPFLVMELLEGQSLREVVREGKMDLRRLVDLGTQMAQGLARAHDFGIVHRDLKPENVFVLQDVDGRDLVKLVDFGIAQTRQDTRLTNRGEIVGTPQYMAPDRALSSEVTPSCDLYSLGVVLYEMATGVLPFEANSATGFVLKHIHEEARPAIVREPSIPVELDRLIQDLMAKDPIDRPVDAHKVVERLQALEAAAPSVARAGPSEPPSASHTGFAGPSVEHTGTLDGWNLRASLFEEMIARAYGDAAPVAALQQLASLRDGVGKLRALREQGVRAQRELDELEGETRARSERLGHAVHVLAIDLSRAREEDRAARGEAESRLLATVEAKAEFDRDLSALEALVEQRPEHPGEPIVVGSRALAEAAERWQRADRAAERSRLRGERSAAELEDLGFQVAALRAGLARLEGRLTDEGAQNRELLTRNGADRRAVEQQLVELAEALIQPLRARPELEDLFVALAGTSSPSP